MTEFVCNGEPTRLAGEHPHLLAALRDELRLTAAKDGCAPAGDCGACTVLVDGSARIACQTSLARVDGAEVRTVEGFEPDERATWAAAMAHHGALQCGYCIPGIVARGKAMVDKFGDRLTEEQVVARLGAHLCRCTGYRSIVEAIMAVANGWTPEVNGLEVAHSIGTSAPKYEADDLALGDRDFIADMTVPAMLHGAVHLTEHTRADIVAIDTEPALAHPGVVGVFTAEDVPGARRTGLIDKDWPPFVGVGETTAYTGDVLALVVAETREIARTAAEKINVRYGVLDPITNPIEALQPESPVAVVGTTTNVLGRSAYRRGDTDKAFDEAHTIVAEVFQTQRVEHAFVEPESTLAVPVKPGESLPLAGSAGEQDLVGADWRLMVYTGGQGIWDDRDEIAAVLAVDPEQVVTELVSNGGAFGGKEDLSNQTQTALAAWLLKRPVKTTFSREESIRVHSKRHPLQMAYRAGCDEHGNLVAVQARMIGDSGSYASVGMKVLERAAGHAIGPYAVPNVDVESIAVRTNNPVGGAFRGFGVAQVAFAIEGIIDRLADAIGLDRLEMRLRNVLRPGSLWGPGQVMDDGVIGAARCLEDLRPAYREAIDAGKRVGIGLGMKNSGLGNGLLEVGRAVVRFLDSGVVEIRHPWTEMGQGVHTVALQVAVEELDLGHNRIRVLVDTTRELGAGQTTGSRATLMAAGAIRGACQAAIRNGCEIGVDYHGEFRVDSTTSIEAGSATPLVHSAFGYGAQLVVIDPDTGDVERVRAAHDVGRAINPQLCEGQVVGSVHMGLGYALSEGLPCGIDGHPLHPDLRSQGIVKARKMPPVEVSLIEVPQPGSPYGIKGVGEIGLVPTVAAVASAMSSGSEDYVAELPIRSKNRERGADWVSQLPL